MNRPIIHVTRILAIVLAGALVALAGTVVSASDGAPSVKLVVLLEQDVSATQAQRYLDAFVERAARQNEWGATSSLFATRRDPAVAYIAKEQPQLGILSLGAFLALRDAHDLTVVGAVEASGVGGRRFHIVSQDAKGVEDCKGAKLATNHLDDRPFIDRVVLAGGLSLGDFDVVETKRPVQTLKAVLRGNARCALIDDAQLASLPHIDGGQALRAVWDSEALPAFPVVAFAGAPAPLVARFKASLPRLCEGDGKADCEAVGIEKLLPSSQADYQTLVDRYEAKR